MFSNLPTIHIRIPERGGNILHLNPRLAQASLPWDNPPGLVFPGAHELGLHQLVWHVVNVGWAQSPLSNISRLDERIHASLGLIGLRAEDAVATVDGFSERDLLFEGGTAGCRFLDRFMLWQGDLAMRILVQSQIHFMRLSQYYMSAELSEFDDKKLKEYREFARDFSKEVEQSNERHIKVLQNKAIYDDTLRRIGALYDIEAEVAEELEEIPEAVAPEEKSIGLSDDLENELDEPTE